MSNEEKKLSENKTTEMTQKEKVKKFIEQAIKAKKVLMKDVIEFISKENIDSEYVTKIYDELDKAKVNLVLDDEDDEKDLQIEGKIKEELDDPDKKGEDSTTVTDLDIEPDLEDIDEAEKIVNHLAVREFIQDLEERERKIILLRYYQEKTQTEVAKMLGISQVQVSRMEKKILLAMREKIG